MTNYSCAKRAADPSNQCAACPQWCGDVVKCVTIDEPLIGTMLSFYKTSSHPMQNYLRGEGPNPDFTMRAALNEACDAIEEHAKTAFTFRGKPVDEQEFQLAWAAEDNVDYWRWVRLKKVAGSPRFKNTFCSQCGEGVGPGDSGYSNCNDHP